MKTFHIDDLHIAVDKEGARAYSKADYPLRYGRYAEIGTSENVFQFNLNGELKFISGRNTNWPDPSEWLKRTIGNDWVYYSTGGYSGLYESFGEYYVPCFSYPSNGIISRNPFAEYPIVSAIEAWNRLHQKISDLNFEAIPGRTGEFLRLIAANSPEELARKSARIHEIVGDRITVLPPDTRHVDYDVVPIIIADGCLYRCGFCRVKTRFDFKERSKADIERQLKALKEFFDYDIKNYNSLFLGQHDALNCPVDLIEFAATRAFDSFDFGNSNISGPNLFLFGSVDSVIKTDDRSFERINNLPFKTYINIGLESADQETLDILRKGITAEAVEKAFAKITDINRRYDNIEITSNFVFGTGLPAAHLDSLLRMIRKNFDHPFPKGAAYFSPLIGSGNNGWKKSVKRDFFELKIKIPVPAFLYLIQRL